MQLASDNSRRTEDSSAVQGGSSSTSSSSAPPPNKAKKPLPTSPARPQTHNLDANLDDSEEVIRGAASLQSSCTGRLYPPSPCCRDARPGASVGASSAHANGQRRSRQFRRSLSAVFFLGYPFPKSTHNRIENSQKFR